MAKLSMLQREKRSFRQHPFRSFVLWALVLTWAGLVLWLRVAGLTSMASTLFNESNPNFWQKGAAIGLAGFPIFIFLVFALIRFPSYRKANAQRVPTEFDRRTLARAEAIKIDDPDHTVVIPALSGDDVRPSKELETHPMKPRVSK